ncbi:flavin-containing monooxygenase [Mycobacterium paragordonae]|uniref:flavin-containing monooxygenase n=1 Tax=Mycobacterium paragordonae TaxID=1389713 RepID=UPI001F0E2172|nr:NAD(P)/FAD-dependent oxidoreductase [Mycobacterium paragordonae]
MRADHDVIIIGAGFGGIGAAIQVKRLGYDNMVILEREAGLGGTWYVNRYPGLAVDTPATTYSYWFEPNPHWSRLFPTGDELLQYAKDVAEKYDVRRHIRFNTPVDSATWDEDARVWQVALASGETLTTRFLITATGFLSQPRTPEIPGIETFVGKVIHSAAWDHSHDFTRRRVALIGTGASGVQLIPELAAEVADLTVFQRTAIHVVPKIDFAFPLWLQKLFVRIPFLHRIFRQLTDSTFDIILDGALHYRLFRRLAIAASDLSKISRFVAIRDKELRRKLTPDYDFGCKRPTWSNRYYKSFAQPHVHLETTRIERIEPDAIVTEDGRRTEIDTLVTATGFDVWQANFPAIEIVGRDGRNLGKWWREVGFQSYQGVAIPHFPNYFSLVSPYGFSSLSFFNTIGYQMLHMERLFGELQRRKATEFEATEEAMTRFMDNMARRRDKSVWHAGDCTTSRAYYFDPDGKAALLRPTSVLNARRDASRFSLTDYAMR